MDYLTHQTTISASTYSSEYSTPFNTSNSSATRWPAASTSASSSGKDAVNGSRKARRTSSQRLTVASSTLRRFRSQRKRFATTESGGAVGNVSAAASQSMSSTSDSSMLFGASAASMSGQSAPEMRASNALGVATKNKRTNRMYQSFLFRGNEKKTPKRDTTD